MKNRMHYFYGYIAIVIICLFIGGNVLVYMISGVLTLISFVMAVESVPLLKWFVTKLSALFEVGIFIFGVYAKIYFGVTIAMALLFAGIGYTMLYRPYLKEMSKLN